MSDSRWHMLSVTICRTGAPLRASRWASLSVAQSPTSAATAMPRSTAVVSSDSSSAVLPGPGARDPVADAHVGLGEPRAQRLGQQVVLLEDALAQVDDAGGHGVGTSALVEGDVEDLQLLAAHDVAARDAAAGAAEVVRVGKPVLSTGRAVDDDRAALDDEGGVRQRGALGGDVVGELECLRARSRTARRCADAPAAPGCRVWAGRRSPWRPRRARRRARACAQPPSRWCLPNTRANSTK